jgi:hypothetical protein
MPVASGPRHCGQNRFASAEESIARAVWTTSSNITQVNKDVRFINGFIDLSLRKSISRFPPICPGFPVPPAQHPIRDPEGKPHLKTVAIALCSVSVGGPLSINDWLWK